MVRKLGREEYCEKENLHQYFLSHDIDEVIKKILENPSEELIHQLMYYVELRTLRNFQKDSKVAADQNPYESSNCCASISYPDGFNPQSNWCSNNRN